MPAPRWYVVASVVGVAMAVLPVALGAILTSVGDALGACNNELGCVLFYVFGICVAPLGFVFGAVASGLKARRLATENASRTRTWKQSFRVGFVALLPAVFFALLALSTLR